MSGGFLFRGLKRFNFNLGFFYAGFYFTTALPFLSSVPVSGPFFMKIPNFVAGAQTLLMLPRNKGKAFRNISKVCAQARILMLVFEIPLTFPSRFVDFLSYKRT